MHPFRAAIYYAPTPADPLWRAGCTWTGRDPQSGLRIAGPHDALTESPRQYGFHATLKPPMRLGCPWRTFLEAAHALAARITPFELPKLKVANVGGFLALLETTPCPALHDLADACVRRLDEYRLPLDASELARRRKSNLSAAEDAMLLRWGYPYVLATWQFHMTLTRRLTAAERTTLQPQAEAHFTPVIALPRQVEEICIFTQAAPDAPFTVTARIPLGGG